MKRIFTTLLFAIFFTIGLFAIDASVTFATFKAPSQGYVEIYLQVVGQTVKFTPSAKDSTAKQAVVEIIILFKKDGQIFKFDKFNLHSPMASIPVDFIDLKRYGLPDGEYELEVSVRDINQEENEKTYNAPLSINYMGTAVTQSDIELLASFRPQESENPFIKSGFFLEPLPFNFYNKRLSKLIFYNEIYKTPALMGEKYQLRYAIEKVGTQDEDEQSIQLGSKWRKVKEVDIALIQMDISKLESGNYQLVVEIRNEENDLVSKKTAFFQRSNPYLQLEKIQETPVEETFTNELDSSELVYGLRAISMNVPDTDTDLVNLLIQESEMPAQRRYLFNYWARYNPGNPEAAYKKYMEVAVAVDNTFKSGFRHGFETDRGWIFMKYGKPHDRFQEENEPTAPPYEIWVYHDLPRTGQRNVKFLFYNPSLITGGYVLLHSTARGELSNRNWEQELYKGEPQVRGGGNGMGEGSNQMFKNARDYFNDM